MSFAWEACEVAKGFDCFGTARLCETDPHHKASARLELWSFDALPNRKPKDWFKEDSCGPRRRITPSLFARPRASWKGCSAAVGFSAVCSCSFDLRSRP